MAELDKIDLDAPEETSSEAAAENDEFYEEQKRHQERLKEHQKSLSHAYGTNNIVERIGVPGIVLIFSLFALNMIFFLLLVMSFFPFSKPLVGNILSFLNI